MGLGGTSYGWCRPFNWRRVMPLKKGSSNAVISHNIAKEMHAGKKRSQAIAIAMSMAGKKKPHKGK